MSSILARTALRSRAPLVARSVGQQRLLHVDNVVGDNMPFKYTGNKKTAYGSKLVVYLISGFSIPFVAAWYQLRKSASG